MPTAAERRPSVEHWLLSAARSRQRARQEWTEQGMALLALGGIMSAVRVPGNLVIAAAGEAEMPSRALDAFLADALDGGPVVCDPRSRVYYALVADSMSRTHPDAAARWRKLGVAVLGHDCYLGVPAVDRTDPDLAACASYWSVPIESAGVLCGPPSVARLVAAGQHALAQRAADVTGHPAQRTAESRAEHARRAYNRYLEHAAGCATCRAGHTCPTGQELHETWRQAWREAR
ncbi:hypothetical protein [Streptomyces sp. bgisy159]|uniref:hypothetical protein n=1 Tax=Streptomyces sp. bgisy159 TaxID=3413795 RepID=UPI003F49B8A4